MPIPSNFKPFYVPPGLDFDAATLSFSEHQNLVNDPMKNLPEPAAAKSKTRSPSPKRIQPAYEFDQYMYNPMDGLYYGYNLSDAREKIPISDARVRIAEKTTNTSRPPIAAKTQKQGAHAAQEKRAVDNRSKIRGLELKLKLTSQDRDNFKNQSMAEHLRYEKMKIVAKDERRKRISAVKELNRLKRAKKSKPAKKRGRRRPVTMSDSSDDTESDPSEEESTIESIKLSKKFRSDHVAFVKPGEASK